MEKALLDPPKQCLRDARRGDAESQEGCGVFYARKASGEELLGEEGAEETWATSLHWLRKASEQGRGKALYWIGMCHATGGRTLPHSWSEAVRYLRMAAEAGYQCEIQLGSCYYYGLGVERSVAQANAWFKKGVAQHDCGFSKDALERGIPGEECRQSVIVPLTNATSPDVKQELSKGFSEQFCSMIKSNILTTLQQDNTHGILPARLHPNFWTQFMIDAGISEAERDIVKDAYAYANKQCDFCGAKHDSYLLCSLCRQTRYCDEQCARQHWYKVPSSESHKALCERAYARGSKGKERAA